MAKHSRRWDQCVYEKYVSEGRGQGEGKDYKPWIRVQDFASHGTVSRIYSPKTGRVHHLLSNNERYYFYLLEWSDQVIDIREQFPLADIRAAMEIAASANIRYPVDNISGFPYAMTCDFMVTTQSGLQARTVKQTSELGNPRVIEKLEIERRYWKRLGINWKLVTEKEISIQKAKAIEWLRSADTGFSQWNNELLNEAKRLFESTELSVVAAASEIDLDFCLPVGTGLQLFRYLVLTKQLSIETKLDFRLNNLKIFATV